MKSKQTTGTKSRQVIVKDHMVFGPGELKNIFLNIIINTFSIGRWLESHQPFYIFISVFLSP